MSIDLVQSLNAYVNSTPQLVTVIFVMYLFIRWLKKDIKEDINKLDARMDNLDAKMDNVRVELKEDISKLDTKIDSVRAELGNRIDISYLYSRNSNGYQNRSREYTKLKEKEL